MDKVAIVQSVLKTKSISVTQLVKGMKVSRNTFYYQLNKDRPEDYFIDSFNEKTGLNLLEIISTGVPNKKLPPFYNVEITASIKRSFSDIREEPEYYIDFPPFNDCVGWLPIVGDSMFPRFQAGEMVALKQIFNMESALWGEPHLVVTNEEHDNLRTIKTIHEHPTDPAKMILRASNPGYKGDTVVRKENILSIYIVKGQAKKSQY